MSLTLRLIIVYCCKMGRNMKKDKQKVIGETFDTDRLKQFLAFKPVDNTPEDFHILLKAYRGLPPEGFRDFLTVFSAAGRNLMVENIDGTTFLDYIAQNQNQHEYVEIFRAHLG